jgi:hypothetical protein
MQILNLTSAAIRFTQTGKGGTKPVQATLPARAWMRFRADGKNHFVVAIDGSECKTRPFNHEDVMVVVHRVEPCKLSIWRKWNEEGEWG